ncbi:hypothetical protein [Flavobacterium granuli]|uniref:Glycosyl-4,4'-diaponeurosporenoate acyltransferase n=1 Tax=Flavobacterium granuli TaxID=280093 RepID=A0ABU1S5K9_9FLAO|nr:hypothetical protein [Flavobacterium granuli]MDR6846326.1 hypothetical protein [Flavobacterium granuli]
MAARDMESLAKVKKTLAWYNMIANLIWSILNLGPIAFYCFRFVSYQTLCVFLTISLIPIFLKKSFIDKLQMGKTIGIYKKLRVHLINKFTQNGAIINNLIKRKFPDHKIVTPKKTSIAGLISQSYMFEKFHLILFFFFSLTIIFALLQGQLLWAIIMVLTNIVYNIYPILLQQYIRLRLILFSKKK